MSLAAMQLSKGSEYFTKVEHVGELQVSLLRARAAREVAHRPDEIEVAETNLNASRKELAKALANLAEYEASNAIRV